MSNYVDHMIIERNPLAPIDNGVSDMSEWAFL